jgi:hypothetical protein
MLKKIDAQRNMLIKAILLLTLLLNVTVAMGPPRPFAKNAALHNNVSPGELTC